MKCNGRGDRDGDHCCYFEGQVCRFYKHFPNSEDRIHVCGLMLELQDWDKVHSDPRYIEHVQPCWDKMANGTSCGSWGGPGCCYEEQN